MFTIKNQEHFREIRKAQTDKGVAELDKTIGYLAAYGGGRFNVELIPDRDGFNVLWMYAESGEQFMVGGLVHFRSDDTWNVHT